MSKHYSYGQTCRPQKSESELALKMKILHAICLYFLYKIFLSSRTSSRILTKTLYTLKIRTIDRLKQTDRKSTRLNSSHVSISYAVFCLKKKKQHKQLK